MLFDSNLDGALAYAQRVELLLAADRLLYAAKDAGCGCAAVQGEPVRMEPLVGAAAATLAGSVPHVA